MTFTRNSLIAAAAIAIQALTLAAPAHAASKLCKLAISANDLIQYDKKELRVAPDCTDVQVTLTHTGKLPVQSMGHDWVLVEAGDLAAVANAGIAAGAANNYIAPNDKRVLAHTKLVGGGQSDTVTFPVSLLKKGTSYKYLCTFPGHNALMNGDFIVG